MSGPSAADLAAAHRWVRDRTVEAMFLTPGAGPEASPMGRRGVVLGPVLAALMAAVLYGQDALRSGFAALVGG